MQISSCFISWNAHPWEDMQPKTMTANSRLQSLRMTDGRFTKVRGSKAPPALPPPKASPPPSMLVGSLSKHYWFPGCRLNPLVLGSILCWILRMRRFCSIRGCAGSKTLSLSNAMPLNEAADNGIAMIKRLQQRECKTTALIPE